jgi:hypothetical protein
MMSLETLLIGAPGIGEKLAFIGMNSDELISLLLLTLYSLVYKVASKSPRDVGLEGELDLELGLLLFLEFKPL